ncbi:MAG: SUF system NifU family Fe-S cluster assembly protein [Trueperaceae bacterium]|nr:SUF system NifU family Fe-S cluster assembly protein [Trueperaceae bacterium]
MGFLDSLYKEAILEHARAPRNRGALDPVTVSQEGLNPSCGDELEIHLHVSDGVVRGASFTGQGCAISQASASMMTDVVRGATLAEAHLLVARFKAMIRGEGPHESLGDAVALEGIAKLHARVKCATLAWVTVDEAMGRLPAEALASGGGGPQEPDVDTVVPGAAGASSPSASASSGAGVPTSEEEADDAGGVRSGGASSTEDGRG